MDLALSNFAWDEQNQDLCFEILKQNKINNIEIIFNKIKGKFILTDKEIIDYKKIIDNHKLNIYSAQSLFYNTPVNNIIDINIIIETFERIIKYANILGIKVLVFGSPSIRKKSPGWKKLIKSIFLTIDDMLKYTDITVVIEPNSRIYNGEFFININEIISFIQKNKLNKIKTMIDTHNLIIEKTCPIKTLYKFKDYIYHIHISELNLHPIINKAFHINFSAAIKNINYDKVITYEVNNTELTLKSIPVFSNIYY